MAHRSGYRPQGAATRHAAAVSASGSRLLADRAQRDPGPLDLTPHRARVTIREVPRSRPRQVNRTDIMLHVVTAVLAITLLVVLLWLR